MNENNMKTLSELQNSSSKIVLAGGVFDIIHPGHINTLNAAKKLGDVLVVVIATDKTAVKMKKRKPLHSAQLRQELVSSLKMVDLCIIGNDEDIFKTVDLVKPQVIVLGYDQTHQEKFIIEGCRKINLEVVVARLKSPRPETSSSSIQKEYGDDIHGL
ncbi:MAG: FAD synthase [Crenarchaeota archaeon]|nr:FAD synthase [Thermoproteota archaeon]MDA1124435.1 FAD synthase [Thermoproteota archaeon]